MSVQEQFSNCVQCTEVANYVFCNRVHCTMTGAVYSLSNLSVDSIDNCQGTMCIVQGQCTVYSSNV
jgi:hypothetical protein